MQLTTINLRLEFEYYIDISYHAFIIDYDNHFQLARVNKRS